MNSLDTSNRVPALRLRHLNDGELRPEGDFVLYWMTGNRRSSWNFALDRALELAEALSKPLVVLEALRCDYPWASDRHHRFVLQGMADNRRAFQGSGVEYYPFVECELGQGKGLLGALSERACVIVADDTPNFFLPAMHRAAAAQVSVRMESVDSVGILPMRAAPQSFLRAYDFRRFLQKALPEHLPFAPRANPVGRISLRQLRSELDEVQERWRPASEELLEAGPFALSALPIDHEVGAVELDGGSDSARATLEGFLDAHFDDYGNGRNHPDDGQTSGLSPFLHYGQISSHEVFAAIAERETWTLDSIQKVRSGAREGWWGMQPAAEGFLDQLITWRELGANFANSRDDAERYESLPDWALESLQYHSGDERPYLYELEEFRDAQTHDELWNAAQRELLESGSMHGYLRMLWGKKILHWSPDARLALATMVELNNRYALDGRDFNSYSGIFWVLGRYDRPWGPQREVFGKIRYMSSRNTHRKLRLKQYLERWSPERTQSTLFPS